MAEHNLMDYSLLLITEMNPDFKDTEKSCTSRSDRYMSVKTTKSGSALRQDSNTLLKRQTSGIPEV